MKAKEKRKKKKEKKEKRKRRKGKEREEREKEYRGRQLEEVAAPDHSKPPTSNLNLVFKLCLGMKR